MLEQSQISLGHASIQTTERVHQNLTDAPCDHLGVVKKLMEVVACLTACEEPPYSLAWTKFPIHLFKGIDRWGRMPDLGGHPDVF